jgi:hypothetical protein
MPLKDLKNSNHSRLEISAVGRPNFSIELIFSPIP